MPEQVPPVRIQQEKLDEKTATPKVPPATPSIPKPQPVELEFDEGDTLFRKRTDV